jgi:hypothetical protein
MAPDRSWRSLARVTGRLRKIVYAYGSQINHVRLDDLYVFGSVGGDVPGPIASGGVLR